MLVHKANRANVVCKANKVYRVLLESVVTKARKVIGVQMDKMVWTEEMEKRAKLVPLDQLANREFKVSEVLMVTEANEDKTDDKEFKDQSDQEVRLDHRAFKVFQVRMVKTQT